MDLDDEPVKAIPILLGILGSRNDATPQKITEACMNPILSELGRCPERMIVPAEGYSSIFLQDWSEQLKIPVQVYEADWRKHNRRAKIFRDTRIEKEATHFIIFLNKRSSYYENVATRLAKKGKQVFTVQFNDWSLENLVCEKKDQRPKK